MPESGEWFSPRTRPEMLTSDDPPIPGDKPELVRILPGPATTVGRATAPLRRLVGVVPAIGRRIVRVDADQPSRWQVVGMWTSGSAIVAATGLAVATVLGGAPSALTQPFHQLTGLPGIGNEHSQSDAVSSTDKAAAVDAKRATGPGRGSSGGSPSATGGYSGGSAASVVYPDDLVPGRAAVPGVPSAGAPSGGTPAAGAPSTGTPVTPPAGGGGTTVPAPPTSDPTTAPTTDPPVVTDPTQEPTDPGTPTEDPTDPPPTVDPTPVDPTPETTPAAPPDQPPADDPPVADPTQDQPIVTPTPDPTSPAATP